MTSEPWSITHKGRISHGRIHRYRYCDVLRLRLRGTNSGGGRRMAISNFSKASARRFRFAFETRSKDFTQFLTLTFPREVFRGCDDESSQRERLQRVCRTFLQRARRIKADYLWVAEPQSDGTPHYHFLVSSCGSDYRREFKEVILQELVGLNYEFNEIRTIFKKFLKYGLDLREINRDGIERYLAKTCAYAMKTADGQSAPLMMGWRRWGRNYKSVPWSVEAADEKDLSLAVYASALSKRNNALISVMIAPTGILHGGSIGDDEITDIADEPPNQWACLLTSGARNTSALNW